MAAGIPARLSATGQGRTFGLQVGPALLVLAGVAYWRGKPRVAVVLGTLGMTLFVLGLVAPALLAPVNRAWMALARAISTVTQPIFLGIVYFLAFLPVGGVMRLFGRNPMVRPRGKATFWTSRPAGARRSQLERQF